MLNSSTYFRISVTSKCNLSCHFCHREGNLKNDRVELTPEEIQFACKVAYGFGFKKFKITGGEPTERTDLCRIISLLSELCLPDLSMITNGTNLDPMAQSLWDAGLRRLNVTVNTLDPNRFRYFEPSGKVSVSSIVKGIEKAQGVGFRNLKVNFVFFNEESYTDLKLLLEFVREKQLTLVILPVIGGISYSLDDMYKIIQSFNIISEERLSDNEGLLKRKINLKSGASILLRLDELSEKKPYIFCDQCVSKSKCREGIFPIRLSSSGELIPCMANANHHINVRRILREQNAQGMEEAFRKIRMWETGKK